LEHGQEVKLTLDYAHSLPVLVDENSNQTGQQVKVILNYTIANSSVLNQIINAVMKVTSNKTLVKTSSCLDGFIANSSDVQQLATTLVDSKLQNVTAVVQFTDAVKMVPM
jgi:hypothetical protein